MFARMLLLATIISASVPAFAQHAHHAIPPAAGDSMNAPREQGQSAFAAIQEIVALLEADPQTDWSKVDIEALRRHLIDMDNVTMGSQITVETVEGGARFVVTGQASTIPSIQRM